MRHGTDGALVRWLDQECDAREYAALSRHLEDCAGCRERLGRIGARSEALRRALREGLPRRGTARWRAAGVAAAGLIALAAVRPVRAWVVERAGAVWAAVIGTSARPDPGSGGTPAAAAEGSVSFVPAGDSFAVRVRARQPSGRLLIEFANTAVASARLSGDAAGAELVVLPSGLRIANTPNSRANYVLDLPGTLETVTVMVADEPPVRLKPGGTDRWEVDLAARRAP